MNSNLLFDFTVNKDNNTIIVNREFNASLALVWKAWTTAELLDQWWGPKPWRAETKIMDFSEGGFWLYAMVSPEGERHWSKVNYITIVTEKSISAKDGFCDENGIMNLAYPQNLFENKFIPKDDKTLVEMLFTFDSYSDLKVTIDMGFKEGFTMGLKQLDALLFKLKNN